MCTWYKTMGDMLAMHGLHQHQICMRASCLWGVEWAGDHNPVVLEVPTHSRQLVHFALHAKP